MHRDHAIRVILAGTTNDESRPVRGCKRKMPVRHIARGKRESMKMWLLMNPSMIPVLLAKKLKVLNAG